MTKTKKQQRAEAVERLKNIPPMDTKEIRYVRAILGSVAGMTAQDVTRELIDLLTDDGANDDSAPEKDVSGEAVDATTDSRDKLLEDANALAIDYWDRKRTWGEANDLKRELIALLDRQAAITERECRESEMFRAGIIRDAVESGETVDVFGVPYVPKSDYDEMKSAVHLAKYLRDAEFDDMAEQMRELERKLEAAERAYRMASHERDEFREKLSRSLDLAHEIERLAD